MTMPTSPRPGQPPGAARKRRRHPARRSRRLVGAGSVAAMFTITGCLAAAGQTAATSAGSSTQGTASSATTQSTADATTATTAASVASATPGTVSSQANTVSSGS